jgi:DNA-binding GntR family transcriptional regulator
VISVPVLACRARRCARALAVLAREGLFTHSLHRDMEVAQLASADVRDIYAMRRVIELAGAESLVAGSPVVLEELERAVHAMSEATALRDRRRMVAADVAFHTAIVAGLGAPVAGGA